MTFRIDIHTDGSILAAFFWYGSIVCLSGGLLYTLYTGCIRTYTAPPCTQVPNCPAVGTKSGLHEIQQVTDPCRNLTYSL